MIHHQEALYSFWLKITRMIIKIHIFIVHLWLPRAHVDAPVSGSVILAGVLLKLGGYVLLLVFSCIIQIWL